MKLFKKVLLIEGLILASLLFVSSFEIISFIDRYTVNWNETLSCALSCFIGLNTFVGIFLFAIWDVKKLIGKI